MAKEVLVEKKEVTFFEIIKVGPIENFPDSRRKATLKSTFGEYLKFYDGPPVDADDFFPKLREQMDSYEDLVAVEVSPELDNKLVWRIVNLNYDAGVQVIQPRFSSSAFIRYVAFGLSDLLVTPLHLCKQK